MASLRELLLVFDVQMDTGPLEKGVEQAERGFSRLIGGVKKLGSVWEEVALVAVVSHWVEAVVDGSVDLLHASERIGLSAQQLKFWRYAGQLVGVEAGEMDISLRKLSQAIGGLGPESKEVTEIFTKLGVKTKDAHGEVRTLDDILPDIVANFAKLKEGPEQVAAAVKLFGRNGAAMIPFLKQGADGLRKMNTEFLALAGTVNNESLEAAESFEQSQIKLGVVWKTLRSAAVSWLIPMLEKVSNFAIDAAVAFRNWNKETDFLATAIKTGLVYSLIVVAPLLWSIVAPLLVVAAELAAATLLVDDFVGAWQGKDSLIGRIIDRVFGKGTTQKIVAWLKEAAKTVEDWWGNLDFGAALKRFGEFVKLISALWGDNTKDAQDKFQALLSYIEGAWRAGMKKALGDVGGDVLTEIVSGVLEVVAAFREVWDILQDIADFITSIFGPLFFHIADALDNIDAREKRGKADGKHRDVPSSEGLTPEQAAGGAGKPSAGLSYLQQLAAQPTADGGGAGVFGYASVPAAAGSSTTTVENHVPVTVQVAPGTPAWQAAALRGAAKDGVSKALDGFTSPNRAADAGLRRGGNK